MRYDGLAGVVVDSPVHGILGACMLDEDDYLGAVKPLRIIGG